MIKLYDYQADALKKIKNGSILCGGVGSGKSITALAYYLLIVCKGCLKIGGVEGYEKFHEMENPMDLYIITTAKKRDSLEWEKECSAFTMHPNANAYEVKVTIDSWNNIKKYKNVNNSFFIFDEQRLVGNGVWVKTFLKIARMNKWILLSATPGDQWSDYIPVFIANGFYLNKTEFCTKHCVYSRYAKYPKVDHYIGVRELRKYRDTILVTMKDNRETVRHEIHLIADYDKDLYRTIMKDRWDPYENEPIAEGGKLIYLLRRVVNTDPSRIKKLDEILKDAKRVIVFYNHQCELEILKEYLDSILYPYSEWNGKRHEELPEGESWVYLVQYTAGCEGWNCITTNVVVFFSQNYSYRVTEQAAGRIDRINTKYKNLYYYYFHSEAPIDLAIHRCLKMKRNFNESSFIKI